VSRARIAARHSDLARLQAQAVGRCLLAAHPGLELTYDFRASLGDANLQDPLWKMPEKGVFTEDFVADLVDGRADFVVHSWKDLPTAPRERTEIVATLPRADGRDLLLMRRDRLEQRLRGARNEAPLRVLSSSPRRAYNLAPFLREALPFPVAEIAFESVRGNVPTRVRKLFGDADPGAASKTSADSKSAASGSAGSAGGVAASNGGEAGADALIVAKAAIDRLLATEDWGEAGAEYSAMRAQLRERLRQCRWMALPLSVNPGAAAQGALAIEIRRDRDDARALLAPIHCAATFAVVARERAILASHGGGCHQKIGVACLSRPYGEITFLRGLADTGAVLDETRLDPPAGDARAPLPLATSPEAIYPTAGSESGLFRREALPSAHWEAGLRAARGLWVARDSGLPAEYRPSDEQLVWCAGVKSWRKLAARGIWVNGCADGLGEAELPLADRLAGETVRWTKVSHDRAEAGADAFALFVATYRLIAQSSTGTAPDFRAKTHFFWMSGTAFAEAIRVDPSLLRRGYHACGPGKTAQVVARALGCDPSGRAGDGAGRFSICLSADAWRARALGQSPR
jgi:hydroxymethylbilane synthase